MVGSTSKNTFEYLANIYPHIYNLGSEWWKIFYCHKTINFFSTHLKIVACYICLRSRPVDPNVTCPSVRSFVSMLKKVMTKWQHDKMPGWQDDRMAWQNDRMTRWQDDRMTRWQDDRMAGWQENDRMTGWQDGRMTGWQGDRVVTGWQVDRMTGW